MIPSGPFGNKFEFIAVAAERAKQLQRGARARIETMALKPVTIAQEEVLAGLVEYSYGPFPEEVQAEAEVGEVTTEAYPGDEARIGTLEPGR
jgi:DNA-directed RNA polymerase omega subunit